MLRSCRIERISSGSRAGVGRNSTGASPMRRLCVPTITVVGYFTKYASCRSKRFGNEISSASCLAMNCPRANPNARLSVRVSPIHSCSTQTIRGSMIKSCIIESVQSVEPSLTMISSKFLKLCPRMDCTLSRSHSPPLCTESNTETMGCIIPDACRYTIALPYLSNNIVPTIKFTTLVWA